MKINGTDSRAVEVLHREISGYEQLSVQDLEAVLFCHHRVHGSAELALSEEQAGLGASNIIIDLEVGHDEAAGIGLGPSVVKAFENSSADPADPSALKLDRGKSGVCINKTQNSFIRQRAFYVADKV